METFSETFSETLFCTTCSRQFQRKHAFETHVQCCPKLLTMGECEESQLPSQSKLYAMILELNKKCIKMQNEIRTLKVYEIKEKKTIDHYEWLANNRTQETCWEDMFSIIEKDDGNDHSYMETLQSNPLHKTMLMILDELIESLPIVIFSHKKTSIYIYHDSKRWCDYTGVKKFRELYNVVHKKLITIVNHWAEEKGDALYANDHLSRVYNDMIEKVLGGTADDGLEKVFKKIDTELRKKCVVVI